MPERKRHRAGTASRAASVLSVMQAIGPIEYAGRFPLPSFDGRLATGISTPPAPRSPVRGPLPHMQRPRSHRLLIALLAVTLLGLGQLGCGRNDGCTEEQAKGSIVSLFEALYLFNDEPAQAAKYAGFDLALYPDVAAVLDELRYLPDEFDRGFSYLTSPAAEERFLANGTYFGFGFMLDDRSEGELWLRGVFEGSPAAAAGLERGDQILEIDGRSIAELEAGSGVGEALGPSQAGVLRTFLVRPVSGGADRSVALTTGVVAIEAVPLHDIFDVDGEAVGYLLFHSFIEPAVPGLIDAFEDFQAAGITRLVIDVRYNGGGLLRLAATINDILGSWAPDVAMGGAGNVGQVQYTVRFNSDNASRDRDETLYADDLALTLDTIVFITSDETASASELLINALEPYRDVYVVGQPTYGKPVGQEARDFCGGQLRLRLVSFELVNADGEGGYFDGLPVDCEAADDLGAPLGSELEASLATALEVATTGACPAAPMPALAAPALHVPSALGPGAVPWLAAF
jgi:C-terminal processing protease CtpA/Prc